ncbi:hypothetical protein HDU76_002990 [Blyttiomyces sp. JEL0837]|nr:hypothetical protein HDU76_002990 [Blyttiomyces sp. JEL0837]
MGYANFKPAPGGHLGMKTKAVASAMAAGGDTVIMHCERGTSSACPIPFLEQLGTPSSTCEPAKNQPRVDPALVKKQLPVGKSRMKQVCLDDDEKRNNHAEESSLQMSTNSLLDFGEPFDIKPVQSGRGSTPLVREDENDDWGGGGYDGSDKDESDFDEFTGIHTSSSVNIDFGLLMFRTTWIPLMLCTKRRHRHVSIAGSGALSSGPSGLVSPANSAFPSFVSLDDDTDDDYEFFNTLRSPNLSDFKDSLEGEGADFSLNEDNANRGKQTMSKIRGAIESNRIQMCCRQDCDPPCQRIFGDRNLPVLVHRDISSAKAFLYTGDYFMSLVDIRKFFPKGDGSAKSSQPNKPSPNAAGAKPKPVAAKAEVTGSSSKTVSSPYFAKKQAEESDSSMTASKTSTRESARKRAAPEREQEEEEEKKESPKKSKMSGGSSSSKIESAASQKDVVGQSKILLKKNHGDAGTSVKVEEKKTPDRKSTSKSSKKSEDAEPEDPEKKAAEAAARKANYLKVLARQKGETAGPSALGSKEIPEGAPNCLDGYTFVFTGELSSITREDAQDLVKRYGGRVTTSISKKTSFVVVGADAGPAKLKKVEELKVKTLDEDALFDLIKASAPVGLKETKISKTEGKKVEKISAAVAESTFKNVESESHSQPTTLIANPRREVGTSELWTTKYKPKSYKDLMGNNKNVSRLAEWLNKWNAHAEYQKTTDKDKENICAFRAVLISGPPGIGKTTAAHLVAKIEGFEVVEFNASDTRSKKAVEGMIKELAGSHSVVEYFSRGRSKNQSMKQVLIMDEVDGMSAGDRGGVAELINVIKKTKIPIVCICNDRQSPKVKSLANYCYDMRFQRPRTAEIEKSLKAIAQKEGLELQTNVVDSLVKATHSDIRQILNLLETYAIQGSQLSFDGSKALTKSAEKNMSMNPFDATSRLLGKQSFREMPFNDKLELYFLDFSLMPLMVQENYIKMDPALARENTNSPVALAIETLSLLSSAADSIADADITDNFFHKTNNWGLMPFHGISATVRPAFFTHGNLVPTGSYFGGGYAFPGWLGRNSTQGKNARTLKEIQLHMRLHISADKNEIRQSYLSPMVLGLTQPLIKDGAEGIDPVIDIMDHYFLTREDWEALLELGLQDYNMKAVGPKIQTQRSHPKPFMTAIAAAKAKSRAAENPDIEDAVEVEDDYTADDNDNDESEGDDNLGADRLIKVKKSTAGASAKSSQAGPSSKKAASSSRKPQGGEPQKKRARK